MDSQPTNSKVPNGYLSNAEIAENHPDWAEGIERGVASVLNSGLKKEDCLKVMVYINEPIPLVCRLWSSEDGEIEVLPNQKEIPMLAMDAIWLIGDPKMRLDLYDAPDNITIDPAHHKRARTQLLDYCFRDIQRKFNFEGQKSMYYGDGLFRNKPELKNIQENNNKYNLWDKVVDLRIKVGGTTTAQQAVQTKSMTQRVREAMERCGVPLDSKRFETEQVHAVKDDLLNDADMYGYAEQIKGKHSDEHIRIMMKDAVDEFAPE